MLVAARLPSSERRQENRDGLLLLGSLTTTRGAVVWPPVTVVERDEPAVTLVPSSTTAVETSQTGPVCTELGIVAGAHGVV